MEPTDVDVRTDDETIYALIQLSELKTRLDLHELERQVLTIAVPRTSQERHIKEYGHRLRLGCCAKRNLEAAG